MTHAGIAPRAPEVGAPDPYALIARFYEAEYGHLEADVAFFARHAAGGRLLVLGCGTGRIARRLAADRPVVGLDRSTAMLQVARDKAPDAAFIEGDMRDFDLGRFDEIIVPNGAFAFLPTRADQARCLSACRRALSPGGSLTIDLPMPAFSLWAVRHSPPVLAWEGEVDGRPARRTRETRRRPALQRLEILDRYTVDGELVATSELPLRLVLPGELEWMLESSGFWVDELWGDYTGGRVGDDSPRLIARAVAL